MLDQNTDRMWYVIGAVLIGAAIIFGMNTLMPSAFASVGDMYGVVIEELSWLSIDRELVRTSPTGIEYKQTWYLNADNAQIYSDAGFELGDPIDGYLFNKTGYYHLLSEPISANAGDVFEISSDHGTHYTRYVIYDSNGNVLEAKHAGSPEVLTLTMPTGTSYFRFSTDIEENPPRKPFNRTDLNSLYVKKL